MALACDCLHNLPACLSGSAGKYCGVLPYGSGRPRNTGECPHRVQGIRRLFPALGPSDRCAQGPRPPVLAHVRHRGHRESSSVLDVQYLLGHSTPDMVRRYSATYNSEKAAHAHEAFSPADRLKERLRGVDTAGLAISSASRRQRSLFSAIAH